MTSILTVHCIRFAIFPLWPSLLEKPLKKVLVMYSSNRTSNHQILMRHFCPLIECGSKYDFFVIVALNLDFKRKNSNVYIPQSFVFSVKIQLSGV